MENTKFHEIILKGMAVDPKFYTRLALLLTTDELHQLVEGVRINWKLDIENWIKKQREEIITAVVSDTRTSATAASGFQVKVKYTFNSTRYFSSQVKADTWIARAINDRYAYDGNSKETADYPFAATAPCENTTWEDLDESNATFEIF